MNMFKSIACFWYGHDWTKVHGLHDLPDFGAVCRRCGLTSESKESWQDRNNQT